MKYGNVQIHLDSAIIESKKITKLLQFYHDRPKMFSEETRGRVEAHIKDHVDYIFYTMNLARDWKVKIEETENEVDDV